MLSGNTLEIFNASSFAPDIDKIEIDATALLDGEIIFHNRVTSLTNLPESRIQIHPNPNNGQFKVYSDRDQWIKIIDISGKTFEIIQVQQGENTVKTKYHVKGIYFLHTTSGDQIPILIQ